MGPKGTDVEAVGKQLTDDTTKGIALFLLIQQEDQALAEQFVRLLLQSEESDDEIDFLGFGGTSSD